MVRISDPTKYHALFQALTKTDPDFTRHLKKNHVKLSKSIPDHAQILVPGCYHAQELVSLSVINKSWKLMGLEPEVSFLNSAIRRVESLDLQSRMELLDHTLSKAPGQDYHAAISTLHLHFQGDGKRELNHLQNLHSKLGEGGKLIVTVVAPPAEKADLLAETLDQPVEMIQGILNLIDPINDDMARSYFSETNFKDVELVGETSLLRSYLLDKG